jgi:hypothetical protein
MNEAKMHKILDRLDNRTNEDFEGALKKAGMSKEELRMIATALADCSKDDGPPELVSFGIMAGMLIGEGDE